MIKNIFIITEKFLPEMKHSESFSVIIDLFKMAKGTWQLVV